jgi:predicted  nucleic acid-binding Zn-ribbon protein
MMSEIAQNKAKISDLETEEIALLDELEKAKAELKESEKQYHAKVQTIKENMSELQQMEREAREEINRLISERGLKESGSSQDVIRIYSRLLKTAGDPLVKVNNDICGNCHLKLTPQTLAETRRARLSLVTTVSICFILKTNKS